jgi:hypothetical protein
MKNLIWTIALLSLSIALNGQKSIDALFDRYGGKEGFTTVTINGNILKLAAKLDDNKDNDSGSMPKDIQLIRILAQDSEKVNSDNFYNQVIKDLDLKLYEEFMSVKSSNQDVKMLVRTEGNRFKEFILIVGGKDNALIQIKGDMSMDEAKKFADGAKKDHGMNIVNKH